MIIRSYHRGVPGGLAAPFCRGVEPPLAELKALLASAEQEGVSGPVITSAQAVYDDISGYLAYIPFIGSDCERHTAEVVAAGNRVRAFLGSSAPPPIRPDYEVPEAPGIPAWVKFAVVGGIAVYGIALVMPLLRPLR